MLLLLLQLASALHISSLEMVGVPTISMKDGLVVYKIVFLSHESAYNSGCHNACAELYTKSFAADEQGRLNHHRHDGLGCECVTSYDSLRVVGVVNRAETKEDFQGIFSADILPGAVFSDEDYLQTQHRCAAAIAAVKLDTGACRLVTRSQDRSHFLIGAGRASWWWPRPRRGRHQRPSCTRLRGGCGGRSRARARALRPPCQRAGAP